MCNNSFLFSADKWWLTPAFPAKKGLRQGDPMSPYLFVLAMEYLHRSFQQLRNNPQFKHHPRCAKMNLFHICFADDLLMCCRADTTSIHLLFQAFQHFSEVSGLQANMEKSSLHIAGLTVKYQILEELHLTAGELPFKYLGVPLSTRKLTSSEAKGRNTSQSTATKKHRDQNKNVGNNQDGCAENFSMSSSRSSLTEKDREELISLRVQVEDLQKKLLEKDELLKEADILKNEITAAYAELDGLKKGISEKDFSLKSTQVQLSDAQVKLADKKAAIERLEWEAMTSSNKVERLQEDVGRVQEEISSFMQFVRALTENDSRGSAEEYDVIPYLWDQSVEIDNLNGTEMQKLEEAREAYIAAVVAAKENQDEAYLSAAATARSYLQSLVLTT